MNQTPSIGPSGLAVNTLLISVWFGLIAGLVEGVGSLVLNWFGRLPEVWVDILWVSPFFDGLLFGVGGLALAVVFWPWPRLPVLSVAVFLFGFLTFAIWLSLALPWQVHTVAILILAAGLSLTLTRWFGNHRDASLVFWRRSLPVVGGLALLIWVGVQGGSWLGERIAVASLPPASSSTPNILLVVIDALRADHLSSYGYQRSTSPNLDRLAQEGVLFEAAFSTAPYTAPSHASLLTGRYPNEHGVQWLERRPKLDGRYPTLPEALRDSGYRTGAFSANRFWFTREQGFGRGFLHFEDNFHSPGDMMVRTVYGRKFEELVLRRFVQDYPWRKPATEVSDSLVNWLRKDQERPFFAFLNYYDVHDPYFPPQPYRGMFSDKEKPGGRINSYLDNGSFAADISLEQVQDEIDAYDGAIAYVDEEIGQLLATIDEMNLGDDLLVIITSDHGEAFGEHGSFVHANSVYLEEIHVPLIIWRHGRVPAGQRITTPVTNSALPATIVGLLNLEESAQAFPGPTLAKLWEPADMNDEWPLPLAEMEHWPWMPERSPSHHGSIKTLVGSQYHYIEHQTKGVELYKWRVDPLESENVAETEEGPGIIDQFRSHFAAESTGMVRDFARALR